MQDRKLRGVLKNNFTLLENQGINARNGVDGL